MNTALLLIDIQNDYFPNGRLPLEKSTEASQKAKELLQVYRNNKLLVIHVQHISTRPDAKYLLPCTEGAKIHEDVLPLKNETAIKKHYPNSFKDTSLLATLKKHKITHVAIAGMTTHLAIDATARAAYDFGFSCTVLHDACAARNLEFNNMIIPAQNVHHAFLSSLQGTYAAITSVREFTQMIGSRTLATA